VRVRLPPALLQWDQDVSGSIFGSYPKREGSSPSGLTDLVIENWEKYRYSLKVEVRPSLLYGQTDMSDERLRHSSEKKRQAVALRKRGWSYTEIAKKIHVSMSSLSLWLHDVSLTPEHRERLTWKMQKNGRLGARRVREQWEERRRSITETYEPPLNDPSFMLGLGLYWGEGKKCSESAVSLSNTSAEILRTFILWIKRHFAEHDTSFSVYLQHHQGEGNDLTVVQHWSEALGIHASAFSRCHHVKPRSDHPPRRLGYGVAHVSVRGRGVWIIRQKIKIALERVASLM
jgi:transposase-like protein